jgi:hypothetical protein
MAFRWICESIILNLVIGITLNNFLFLSDDVTHQQTPDWSKGSSLSQVEQVARVFRSVEAGRGFVHLCSLRRMLSRTPQPLGFLAADGRDAALHDDEEDAFLFIRAELNLLALQNQARAAAREQRLFGRIQIALRSFFGARLEEKQETVTYSQVAMGADALFPTYLCVGGYPCVCVRPACVHPAHRYVYVLHTDTGRVSVSPIPGGYRCHRYRAGIGVYMCALRVRSTCVARCLALICVS